MQTDLAQYRWHNRLLVLFAPSATDSRLVRQETLFRRETAAMRERDLLKIVVLPSNAALRRRYKIGPNAFVALLVGKDGTVAFRSSDPVTPKRLYALIDVMPMRRDEMRRRKG